MFDCDYDTDRMLTIMASAYYSYAQIKPDGVELVHEKRVGSDGKNLDIYYFRERKI